MYMTQIEEYLNSVAEHMPYPVFWTDPDSRMLGANQSGFRMMGAQNASDIVGKYPREFLPSELADKVMAQVNLVCTANKMQMNDEQIFDPQSGTMRRYTVFRFPLTDYDQKVLGIFATAIDNTAERDAIELKRQQVRSKAIYADWMEQVNQGARDLGKSVANLKSISPAMSNLAKPQRTRFDKTLGELQELASRLRKLNQARMSSMEADEFVDEDPEALLMSGLVHQIRAEHEHKLQQRGVALKIVISDSAQFGFVLAQNRRLKRAVGQLIDNAVSALHDRVNGTVIIKLDGTDDKITLAVQDNGQGMNFEMLDSMLNRTESAGTHARTNGMHLVWNTLENNKGILNVDTIFDHGTSIQLIFPRARRATWIATQIDFTPDSHILVLDANEAQHDIWRKRFDIYQQLHPTLTMHHCYSIEQALKLMNTLDAPRLARMVMLSEYEFPPCEVRSLDVAETYKIGNSMLFTDQYQDHTARRRAANMGVRLASRELAAVMPLHCKTVESDATQSSGNQSY
jgi:PAS domain S-box-containing protein